MNVLNRVSLIGQLDAQPQTLAKDTSCELVTFNIVTRDSFQDLTGRHVVTQQNHKVVVMDFTVKQYIHMFLNKGDYVFVEGQLQYVNVPSSRSEKITQTEIVISLNQGYLRRLDEAPVMGLEAP